MQTDRLFSYLHDPHGQCCDAALQYHSGNQPVCNFAVHMVDFVSKMMDVVLKMMKFALQMMNCALKLMNFALNMMNFGRNAGALDVTAVWSVSHLKVEILH